MNQLPHPIASFEIDGDGNVTCTAGKHREPKIAGNRYCRSCGGHGHNSRACPDLIGTPAQDAMRARCGWCKQQGHNARTCAVRKQTQANEANKEGE
jgi:hypothetical protein